MNFAGLKAKSHRTQSPHSTNRKGKILFMQHTKNKTTHLYRFHATEFNISSLFSVLQFVCNESAEQRAPVVWYYTVFPTDHGQTVQCDPATWASLMPVYNFRSYCQFICQLLVSIYTRFIIAVNWYEHGRFDVLAAVLTIIHVCCDMTPCPPARSKSTYQTAAWPHLQSSTRRANPIQTV